MDINWSRYIEIARAQDLGSGKEAVVFLSKTRKICKIVTTDEKGTMLLTRTLHNGRFEELIKLVTQKEEQLRAAEDLA